MIFSTAPSTFVNGEQLSPEKLNRLLMAAKNQLEEQAQKRWRHWDVLYPPNASVNLAQLPLIADRQYVVDRITIEGTYTGTPTIYWKLAGDSTPRGSFALADGVTANVVNKVVFPGIVLDGTAVATNSNNFLLYSDVSLPNVGVTISLSSPRISLSDTGVMPAITLYKDGDTLTAADFNAKKLIIDTFANDLDNNSLPVAVFCAQFRDFNSNTQSYLLSERFPADQAMTLGTGGMTVRAMTAVYELASTGAGGQTITISRGFNTASNSVVTSVENTTTGVIDLGTTSFQNSTRSVSSSSEDWVITAESNATSPNVKKLDIYYLCTGTDITP
jgi:hypothetical protein